MTRTVQVAALVVLAAGMTPGAASADHHESSLYGDEYYELRVYRVPTAEKQKAVLEFLSRPNGMLALLKELGLGPVGVFTEAAVQPERKPRYDVTVLIPMSSPADSMKVRLAEHGAHENAEPLVSDPNAVPKGKLDPPYLRVESKLLVAFADMPKIVAPPKESGRVFELRTYQSKDAARAALKVEMFNQGEIDVMRDVNLQPVFYGSTLVGGDVPNLAYMLSGPSLEAHKKNWQAFLDAPGWAAIKGLPRYRDTVSKIESVFLVPADCSEL